MKRKSIIEPVTVGPCTLYCGDCVDIMPMVGHVDSVITDPPYGVGVEYTSFVDTKENVAALAKRWLPVARRIAPRVVFTPGITNEPHYPQPDWTMAWLIPSGSMLDPWGFSSWQPVFCYGTDPYLADSLGGRSDLLWPEGINRDDYRKFLNKETGHPCPKPIKFMVDLVVRASLPGHVVLDPFMGSGTTGVACMRKGRKFIGIELDPGYFDQAVKRLQLKWSDPDLMNTEVIERPRGILNV